MSVVLLASRGAWAQASADDPDARPAIPTFLGDTGLWFVPTAEVVGAKLWSASVYRTVLDYNQGFTNLAFFPVTFSAGVGHRTEVFGSLRTVTRIDRDIRPLFVPSNVENGGVLNGYPFVREPWTGNDLGDLIVGGKDQSRLTVAQRSGGLRGSDHVQAADGRCRHGGRHRSSWTTCWMESSAAWPAESSSPALPAWRGEAIPTRSISPTVCAGESERASARAAASGSRPSCSGTLPSTTSSGATPCRLPASTGRGLRSSRSADLT